MKRSNIFTIAVLLIAVFLVGAMSFSAFEEEKKSDLANFEISIQKTADGVKLKCSEGCAWKELSYNRSDKDHIQKINEYGMVTEPSKNK